MSKLLATLGNGVAHCVGVKEILETIDFGESIFLV